MGFSFRIRLINALLLLSLIYLDSGSARSIITSAKSIRDPETLSSNDNAFVLGFFSPQNSTNRYLGIWYLNESNVIWVANRNQPLRNSSGIFTISQDGNLVLLNGNKQVVWSSNVSNIASHSTAELLDTGNLILQDVNKEEIIWESFQHPTDTFVPKMKLSTNIITGKKVQMTSWKSPSDPSNGSFSFSVEMLGIPELFIWNKTKPYWRSGPWNGREFLGISKMKPNHLYGITMDREEEGTIYATFSFPHGTSDYAIFVMNSRGTVVEKDWKNKEEFTNTIYPSNECDIYGFCGSFGTCKILNSPICSCLKGFKPKITEEWSKQNWKSGCVRRAPLQCERVQDGGEVGKSDGFLKLEKTKVPDFAELSTFAVSEDICRNQCLLNCSCKAYAYDAGIGCMTWNGDLVDIQRFTEGGADLYIKLAYSELNKQISMIVIGAVAFSAIVGTIIAATCSYFLWTWAFKYSAGRKQTEHQIQRMIADTKQYKLEELPLYDFKKVASATNDFHPANLLGKGGFGLVYKAWKLWSEENIKALIDPEISNPVFENQIVRCIHIGLLCVQELAVERPCMTTVVSMLNSEIVNLPAPGQAAFVQKKNSLDLVIQEDQGTNLTSHVTLSEVRGR
ncbi:hypothetical protein L6164_036525 [Bauhinia variegata]|uniref:Uncharacterized protein n=1 Tax=Bauhinia variegata TaxID=167791 RepID=A0ACB9KHG6_BAUVA|nr:hypothetical protein L6164_036525 [Bauhinia variegata]